MKYIFLSAFLFFFINTTQAQHQFNNVAGSFGIYGQTGLGHAVGWGDINDDGLLDLAFSNQDGSGFWLYKNEGTQFTNITASAGLSGQSVRKILIADLSGDYYPEIILRSGSSSRLFLNNQDETFTNISSGSGVSGTVFSAADFNNDGHLDLLSFSSGTNLLMNNGDNTFTSQTISSVDDSFYTAVVCFDYNNDNYIDIFMSIDSSGQSRLLKNNGDLTFTDVTSDAGVVYSGDNNATTAGDFNNDGWTDIYLGSYDAVLLGKLFQNNGDGTFNDVTAATGTQGHNDTRTSSFADYNNDGYLDIFSSHHDFYSYSNTLLQNNGDYTFTEVAFSMGISGEWIGDYFGVGWADFDNDADMDLFAAGHIDKYNLFRNDDCPNNSFIVKLKGIDSNKSAVGAKAELIMNGEVISRTVIAGQGSYDFHSLRLHFGMGQNTAFELLKIYWPSGIVHEFTDSEIVLNTVNTIIEDGTLSVSTVEDSSKYISIYPNPVSDILTVETKETINGIKIFNNLGALLFQKNNIFSNILTADLSFLSSGIYFVEIEWANQSETVKFIKI